MADQFPVTLEEAADLAGWLAQIEWGDRTGYEDADEMTSELMTRFMPSRYRVQARRGSNLPLMQRRMASENAMLERKVADKWAAQSGQNPVTLAEYA